MITIKIVNSKYASSASSDMNKTPQNNVAVPVNIASISSWLLLSSLYGFNFVCNLINKTSIMTATEAVYTIGRVDMPTLIIIIHTFLIVLIISQ